MNNVLFVTRLVFTNYLFSDQLIASNNIILQESTNNSQFPRFLIVLHNNITRNRIHIKETLIHYTLHGLKQIIGNKAKAIILTLSIIILYDNIANS